MRLPVGMTKQQRLTDSLLYAIDLSLKQQLEASIPLSPQCPEQDWVQTPQLSE
jgi:hypothetical protein